MVSSQDEISDKLEWLEDEFNLLKTEVRQTLVDLKEFIMKGRTIFPVVPEILNNPPPVEASHQEPQESDAPVKVDPSVPEPGEASPDLPTSEGLTGADFPLAAKFDPMRLPNINRATGPEADPTRPPDSVMMSNIIWWLGTAKRRGMTLHQIAPFIDAYEMSGYMSPTVAKLIYRAMADIDVTGENTITSSTMPQDFSEGLMQLNDIVTSPNHAIKKAESDRETLNVWPDYPEIA